MAKVDRTVSIRQRARYQNFVCDLSHSGELACWLVNELRRSPDVTPSRLDA
ncbi:hypothetical protein D083_3927 [Dickeya solani RNS 08.23.3.1.A]|nr:hypothetical protein D083_3927 [Dickeya solani RNS 08.23.3.1.A]